MIIVWYRKWVVWEIDQDQKDFIKYNQVEKWQASLFKIYHTALTW